MASVLKIPEACLDAWEQAKKVKIPKGYGKVDEIVCCGMGGSSLAAHFIKSLYFDILDRPFEIVRAYHLPKYADQKTLVILLSYSGNTEEVLTCTQEAIKSKTIGVTSNGKLAQFLKEKNLPQFVFSPDQNPAGQPRLGLPYTIFGLLGILQKIGLIKLEEQEIHQTLGALKKFDKNSAEKTAQKLFGKIPIIIGAEHLEGSAHVFANQINETSKNFSAYFILPELNHHLMEGLVKPPTNPKNLIFLFLNSDLYQEEIKKRARLTMEVVEKNKIECLEFNPQSGSKLTQAVEALQFSSFVSYYLAKSNKVNPAQTPWVDYFKNQMAF